MSIWPEQGTPGPCRKMPTRSCPPDGCFQLPCARFDVTIPEAIARWPELRPTREEILSQIEQLKQGIADLRAKLEALGDGQPNGPLDT